jgi:hypothetical protein
MKTLLNVKDKEEIIARLQGVRPNSLRLWGKDVRTPDGLSLERWIQDVHGREACEPGKFALSPQPAEVGCALGSITLAERI